MYYKCLRSENLSHMTPFATKHLHDKHAAVTCFDSFTVGNVIPQCVSVRFLYAVCLLKLPVFLNVNIKIWRALPFGCESSIFLEGWWMWKRFKYNFIWYFLPAVLEKIMRVQTQHKQNQELIIVLLYYFLEKRRLRHDQWSRGEAGFRFLGISITAA